MAARSPRQRSGLASALVPLVLASVLAGCAGPGPRVDATVAATDMPGAWLRSAPGSTVASGAVPTDLARWWQRFDDPTLAGLVEQALAANPDIASAGAAWRQARALRAAAAAGLQPTLGASASAQRARNRGFPATNDLSAGLDASWEMDLFGRLRAGVDAAEADAAASADTLGDVQVSVAAETALAYLSLRGSGLRLAIARDNLAAQDETLQLVRWREQAGLASSIEVQQAQAAADQTRAQVPALQQAAAQTLHALAVLTGQAPAALATRLAGGTGRPDEGSPTPAGEPVPPAEPAARALPIPQPPDDLVLRLPADTLRQRADVRAAERQVQAAAARVEQAEAARLPGLSLGGSIGLGAATLSGLSGPGAVASALFGSVSLPLIDGGARRAQVDAQAAALEQARARHRAVVLAALQEAEDALVALRRTRERLSALGSAAQAADVAALLARQRYGSGLVDFQVVLDTQRSLLAAEDAVAGARTDLASEHVRLYKALGGGWQPEAAAAGPAGPARTGPG